MNRVRCFLLLLLSLCFALPSTSRALEVFGNGVLGNNGNTGGFSFASFNAWAVPFTPGTSSLDNRTLTSARVLVGGDPAAATFSVAIYAAAPGTNAGPTGSALATGSLSLGAGDAAAWHLVTFGTPVVLNASANYYLAVEKATLSSLTWREPTTSTSYTDLGSGSSYQITGGASTAIIFNRTGSTWASSGAVVQFTPLGLQLVPEPSTYVLSALSIGTFLAVRRSRRNRI